MNVCVCVNIYVSIYVYTFGSLQKNSTRKDLVLLTFVLVTYNLRLGFCLLKYSCVL